MPDLGKYHVHIDLFDRGIRLLMFVAGLTIIWDMHADVAGLKQASASHQFHHPDAGLTVRLDQQMSTLQCIDDRLRDIEIYIGPPDRINMEQQDAQ